VVAYYGLRSNVSHDLFCQVTGQLFEPKHLTAAHLWPFAKHQFAAEVGLTSDDVISNPRNGLLMCSAIENAFDRKQVCFIFDPQTGLCFCVLDSKIREQVATPDGVTFSELDGRELYCGVNKRLPFRRVLSTHAWFSICEYIPREKCWEFSALSP
jgi:hypothetical protein